MYSKIALVQNAHGLHARTASDFINSAAQFNSKITIKKIGTEKEANAKSIIMILSLTIVQGNEVEIIANGDDEEKAVETLVSLINSKFWE